MLLVAKTRAHQQRGVCGTTHAVACCVDTLVVFLFDFVSTARQESRDKLCSFIPSFFPSCIVPLFHQIPPRTYLGRHVPEQMWYTHPAFAIALGGVLPFGAVCIELFFIMSALWLHQVKRGD